MFAESQSVKDKNIGSTSQLTVNVIDWIKYIFSKWKIVALGIIGGIGVGGVFFYCQKAHYTAEYSFIITGDKGGDRSYSGMAAQLGLDLGGQSGSVFDENNITTFIKSRSIIEKVFFAKLPTSSGYKRIIDYYLAIEGLSKKWEERPYEKIIFHNNINERTIKEDSIITVFYKEIIDEKLSVEKPDRKSDVMYVKFTDVDQKFAKYFVDNLMKEVSYFYKETKLKNSRNNVDILQSQLDSVKNSLNSSITSVASLIDKTPNANPSKQITRTPSQKKVVDAEMSKMVLSEIVKNLELAKLNLNKQNNLIQTIDYPVLPLEMQKTSLFKCLSISVIVTTFLSIISIVISRLFSIFKKIISIV